MSVPGSNELAKQFMSFKGEKFDLIRLLKYQKKFDFLITEYGFDLVKFALIWAIENMGNKFYSPQYLYYIMDKVKGIYNKEKMNELNEELNKNNSNYKILQQTSYQYYRSQLKELQNDLSIFD